MAGSEAVAPPVVAGPATRAGIRGVGPDRSDAGAAVSEASLRSSTCDRATLAFRNLGAGIHPSPTPTVCGQKESQAVMGMRTWLVGSVVETRRNEFVYAVPSQRPLGTALPCAICTSNLYPGDERRLACNPQDSKHSATRVDGVFPSRAGKECVAASRGVRASLARGSVPRNPASCWAADAAVGSSPRERGNCCHPCTATAMFAVLLRAEQPPSIEVKRTVLYCFSRTLHRARFAAAVLRRLRARVPVTPGGEERCGQCLRRSPVRTIVEVRRHRRQLGIPELRPPPLHPQSLEIRGKLLVGHPLVR